MTVYSIVVPVLNEEACLPELYRRITEVFTALDQPYEIIFVDDGSRDRSIQIVREYAEKDPHVCQVIFTRNFGQQAASVAGFAHVRGDIVCTLDADLQNPPEAFPLLIRRLGETGADMVTGWRQIREDSLPRRMPSILFNRMTSLATGVNLHDYGSNLRVYRRQVTDQIVEMGQAGIHLSALISWLGFRVHEEPVEHHARGAGHSRYGFFKLYRATLDMVTSYSVIPIHIMSFSGFGMAAVGILFGLRILAMRIAFGQNPSGLQTAMALIFLIFGMQMISLGFIGEYLARMFVLVKRQPYYIVKEARLGALPVAGIPAPGSDAKSASGKSRHRAAETSDRQPPA